MIVGVTGHQRLPGIARDYVRNALRAQFATIEKLEGASSLAAGADQLFATEVLAANGILRAVLPSENYESTFTTVADREQFSLLLARAHSVEILQFATPSERAFLEAGRRVAEMSALLIAVWDGAPARGVGGTADIVAYARLIGRPVSVVWPEGIVRD